MGRRLRLLHGAVERELESHDLGREGLGEPGHRFLAIGLDQVGEGPEQGGMGENLGIDALGRRAFPGLGQIGERQPLLLGDLAVVGVRFAGSAVMVAMLESVPAEWLTRKYANTSDCYATAAT